MKFDSLDGGEDDEHSGVGFVQVSKIFVMQGDVFWMSHNHLTQSTVIQWCSRDDNQPRVPRK